MDVNYFINYKSHNMKRKTRYNRLIITVMMTLLIVSGISGCKKETSSPSPGANEVFIQNYAFNPSTITVPVNTTITWTNKDPVNHTVTSDNGLFDSGAIQSKGIYSRQFTTAGTYPYHCSIHTYMTGNVIVQ